MALELKPSGHEQGKGSKFHEMHPDLVHINHCIDYLRQVRLLRHILYYSGQANVE
jgi:hypothetical protein